MCFTPQQRALFRHLNFQTCSEIGAFFHFTLPDVLRTITACNFSSLICPDGSAPAALASLLFRPVGATEHWKTPQVNQKLLPKFPLDPHAQARQSNLVFPRHRSRARQRQGGMRMGFYMILPYFSIFYPYAIAYTRLWSNC